MNEKISGNENCNIINRAEPAWAMFAAAWMSRSEVYALHNLTDESADFADAMIRERDRRDREERP